MYYSCFAASSCATAVGLWCRFCCLSTGVIRNQCLKYIGHFYRFPDITLTKKIFFLLFVFVFKEDAICEIKMATSTRINISKLLNVPNEQTKKRTQVKAGLGNDRTLQSINISNWRNILELLVFFRRPMRQYYKTYQWWADVIKHLKLITRLTAAFVKGVDFLYV